MLPVNKTPEVCLTWAVRRRHIAVDGRILCETKRKTDGYCTGNGQYNTLSLSGLPGYKKDTNDTPYTHLDGYIEYKPLPEQKVKIDTRSICKKCLEKYEKLF